MGPKANDWYPDKKRGEGALRHTETQGRRHSEGGGRSWSAGISGITRNQGSSTEQILPQSFHKESLLFTPLSQTSGLLNYQRINFSCIKPLLWLNGSPRKPVRGMNSQFSKGKSACSGKPQGTIEGGWDHSKFLKPWGISFRFFLKEYGSSSRNRVS